MRISGGLSNGINSMFNTLAQGSAMMHANKLSNSSVLFPQNTAPGKGTVNSSALSYVNDIKSAASGLSSALNELSGSAFNSRTMVSSNTDAMTVSFSGSSSIGMNDMKVKIDQVAAGQVNEGNAMSAATYSGSKGVNKFTVETGGKTTELSVNVSSLDSNKDVQQKMATAINNAGLGLKATVVTDSKTNTSTLQIESSNVGTDAKNAVSIKDTSGNLVATTGANNVSRERQDALYSVNGGATQTSQSNTVNLGNGISATFKEASASEVTITRGTDLNRVKSAVTNMVNSFNSLISAAAGNTADPKAQGLSSRMINVSNAYSRSLSDVGIGFDTSGRMTIDTAKLDQAAQSGKLEDLFKNSGNNRNFGFTATLGRLASQVTNNTSNFVTNSMFGNNISQNFAYSGTGNSVAFNAANSGSIFDFQL